MTGHPYSVGQLDVAEQGGRDGLSRAGQDGRATTLDTPAACGWLDELVKHALAKKCPSRQQALAVLRSGDSQLLDVIAAAARVRRQFFGHRVKLNYLVNMKSGLCPEDCSYCSQRRGSQAQVLKYNWLSPRRGGR